MRTAAGLSLRVINNKTMTSQHAVLYIMVNFGRNDKQSEINRHAAGKDEIRPEMLKTLNSEGILWLTRMC